MAVDPPRRRWFARSPQRSIIIDTEQIKLRVGWRAQLAAMRWVGVPLLKIAIGAGAAALGFVMWRC